MGRVLTRLRALLPARRARSDARSLAERFRLFRAIGAANDAFLASLDSLRSDLVRGTASGSGGITSMYAALAGPVAVMARTLVELAGERYQSLVQRVETLERDLAVEVLSGPAREGGALVTQPEDGGARRPEPDSSRAARMPEPDGLDVDPRPDGRPPDPVRGAVHRLLDRVEPLTLAEPDSPRYRPENCTTLRDIARFVHQRSMVEMLAIGRLTPGERRRCRRLGWSMPMDVLLLDLGGGLAPFAGRTVPVDYVNSLPLQALIEGMTDPRLRRAGPVGFDLKGFISVVVRSAADDQRYGEPSYALCSSDYVHFASRLAYHFATADAICGSTLSENYARLVFFGGAAVAERRELRAHFLATVLRYYGFAVKHVGDRVEAVLAERGAEQIEESLVMLGRLMVASRHLDMVISSRMTADALADAFLSGDYGFQRVRRAGT
jgi:hypothetical protein